jgi:hypothetical protein
MSECITQEEFEDMVKQKLTFNKIVFIDGEGKQVVSLIGDIGSWDNEKLPNIQSIKLARTEAETIQSVHSFFEGDPMEYGMG